MNETMHAYQKYFLKIVAIILIVFAGIWIYNWYLGKVAPSVADPASAIVAPRVVQIDEPLKVGTSAVDTVENTSPEKTVSIQTVADTAGVAEAIVGTNAVAYVAGGCFWCTEADYGKIPGVIDAVSGYMGGAVDAPSYRQVVQGDTGHRETVKVTYNPTEITYKRIVLELFRETDPTDAEGSFYDRGYQYTSAIYYQTQAEKDIAEAVIKELNARELFTKPITTSVEPAGTFWIAEKYHQDYAKRNPLPYKYYRSGSGRDAFIQSAWGNGKNDDLFNEEVIPVATPEPISSSSFWNSFEKPSNTELKETLTSLQYYVTQKEGTERPFQNEYWDNHEDGIYVDIVSGEPLFSSTDKYDSGTGWPSFLKPIDYDFVIERDDYKLIFRRTEIRSKIADSHLGHIIMDGPKENNYIRYCMNSASMRFVPAENLKEEGYEKFMYLFEN